MNQLDFFAGRAAMIEGTDRVLSNNEQWASAVGAVLNTIPSGTEFTSDDLRMKCHESGIRDPKHHNSWGAFFSKASKQKLITNIGTAKSAIKSRHTGLIRVWIKL